MARFSETTMVNFASSMRITVLARIIGGFLLVLLLAAAIMFAGLWGISEIENNFNEVTGKAMPLRDTVGDAMESILQGQIELVRFQNTQSPKELDKIERIYNYLKNQNIDALESLTTLTINDEDFKDILVSAKEEQTKMFSAGDKMIVAHRAAVKDASLVQEQSFEFTDMGDEIISYSDDLESLAQKADTRNLIRKLTHQIDNTNDLALGVLDRTIAAAVASDIGEMQSNYNDINALISQVQRNPRFKGTKQMNRMADSYERFKGASINLAKAHMDLLKQRKEVKKDLKIIDSTNANTSGYLGELIDSITDYTDEVESSALTSISTSKNQILIFALIALVSAGIIVVFVSQSIRRPLKETINAINTLATGDLTQTIKASRNDELGDLMNTLNQMSNKLVSIVSNVKNSAESVSQASTQIERGNTALSQRAQEQASSLEETASSMEEMTSTVGQNAENSAQARTLVMEARSKAEQGGSVVNKATKAMSEISESSKKIAEIISVVDSIAFQTNLLALNAAVEAARAGEQGRGFAVVASEVRVLAQRSADASKQISDLITDSVEKVKQGTELVEESGDTLKEIVTSVKKVADIVSEIAAASNEQASGIDQVNKSVTQMDEVTQQNSALAEEAAAASQAMMSQARNLNEAMTFFNLGDRASDMQEHLEQDYDSLSYESQVDNTLIEQPGVA